MLFRDFLTSERILDDMSARTKPEAIAELSKVLFVQGVISPELREGVFSALLHREELQSTALGQGLALAIPHAKHPGVHGLVGVFGRSREGIAFDSPDGQPARLFFMLLSNKESSDKHLAALAHISKKFRNADWRNCILRAMNRTQIAGFFDDSDGED